MDKLLQGIGLAAAVIGLIKATFELYEKYREQKPGVPRRVWIWASLALAGVVLVSGVWWWTSRPEYVLTLEVWDVESDHKHGLIAQTQFRGTGSGQVSEEILQSLEPWVVDTVSEEYALTPEQDRSDVHLKIHIPADLSKEQLSIEMIPPWTIPDLLLGHARELERTGAFG